MDWSWRQGWVDKMTFGTLVDLSTSAGSAYESSTRSDDAKRSEQGISSYNPSERIVAQS